MTLAPPSADTAAGSRMPSDFAHLLPARDQGSPPIRSGRVDRDDGEGDEANDQREIEPAGPLKRDDEALQLLHGAPLTTLW